MSETVTSTFTVEDVVNNDVWLKDVERGLRVAVEATGVDYGRDVKKKVNYLSQGDTVEATLKSLNQSNTAWAFEDVEINSESSRNEIRP